MSAWAEESPGSCLLPLEDLARETEEPVADKLSFMLQALGQRLGPLRALTARHSYDSCGGPSEQPQLELPPAAGQSAYVFGKVGEDGWSVGEPANGTRGFVPSDFAKDDSDDDLEKKSWNDPLNVIFSLSPVLEEDDPDVSGGG